jgi:hypothetical protein
MAAFGDRWLDAVHETAARRSLAALADDTTFELGPIDDIIILGASALLMTRELGISLRPLRPRRPLPSDTSLDEPRPALRVRAGTDAVEALAQGGGVPS